MLDKANTKKCPHCSTDIPIEAKKCPNCRSDFRNWFRRHPILTLFLLFLSAPFFLAAILSDTGNKKAQPPKQELTQKEKEKLIDSLATTFCEARTGSNVPYANLEDYLEMLEGKDVKPRNVVGDSPSQESCVKIAEACLKQWGKDDCQKLAKRNIWIGMTKDQLILISGLPKDINNTVGKWGIHTQWVYGDFGPYVYLEGDTEDDLTVTSWQD